MLTVTTMAGIENVLLWGLIATVTMTTILQGSQGLGLSRLSLPFLIGTFFTGNHDRAAAIGFVFYVIGGWVFAFGYVMMFTATGLAYWWFGAAIGAVHALFLLIAVLPLLPAYHPRLAGEHHGPTMERRLEPPGFLGLNYGGRTPLITLLGHAVYGAVLGGFYPMTGC